MKEALKFLNKPLTIRWYLVNSPITTRVILPTEVVSVNASKYLSQVLHPVYKYAFQCLARSLLDYDLGDKQDDSLTINFATRENKP